MYEAESEERTPLGVKEAPRWRWNFKATVDEVRTFVNTPAPLPQGAVSISAVGNGFHIFFFE